MRRCEREDRRYEILGEVRVQSGEAGGHPAHGVADDERGAGSGVAGAEEAEAVDCEGGLAADERVWKRKRSGKEEGRGGESEEGSGRGKSKRRGERDGTSCWHCYRSDEAAIKSLIPMRKTQ